jgi:hypothetical protein
MPLQDLTPQLRTRLSRVERAVGLFITLATLILIAGFAYYIYLTAERKGWFLTKVQYQTSLNNAAGLKPGDPVQLMGFNVGDVTKIVPNDPSAFYGVTIFFRVKQPYYGYIWLDSKVRVAPSDFLGHRFLEIIKGQYFEPTVRTNGSPDLLLLNHELAKKEFELAVKRIQTQYPEFNDHAAAIDATNELNKTIHNQVARFYTPLAEAQPYWIAPLESPALTERLETLVSSVEVALPGILNLTNQLAGVLTNAANASARLETTLTETRPIITNLAAITSSLREPHGALGEWLIPTNLNTQLQHTLETASATLQIAHATLDNTDTNLTVLTASLNKSLENLANLTSNLNAQVQVNTNILSEVSASIIHTDELVQGLKRHWLLRSAFKPSKIKAPPVRPASKSAFPKSR